MIPRWLRGAVGIATAAFATACSGGPPPCDGMGMHANPASAQGRWLTGLASRYPADTSIAARADELHRSQRARRAVAWAAVARTLAPVALARPTSLPSVTVPRFRTWYDREDVTRTFQRLYAELGRENRAAQSRFSDTALDNAFGWNVDFVTTLPEWPSSRLDAYARSLDTGTAIANLGGVQRIAMSPDAVRHLASSYPEILRCVASGAPPSFVDGSPAPQQLAREPLSLTSCGSTIAGPFFVATGGTIQARVDGTSIAGVELRIVEGVAADAPVRCTSSGTPTCSTTGPGIFVVRVSARAQAVTGMLDVQSTPPTADVAACLHGVFPPSAATVALEWRRTDIGIAFPTYDTSAAGLTRRLAPGADASWGMGDATIEPDENAAYTMRVPSGGTFRLAGMHIRTREVDHWLNITLWWSPNPNDDFGADRPEAVRALGGPWSSYKMCVATDFDELDAEPSGGFDTDAPTLAAALRAVNEGRGGASWCSNPYIDGAPGLVRSNCVGCHQHALSGVRPGQVQMDLSRYPSNGRMQVRNNFPSDGFWSLDSGDQLAAVFAETVDWWRSMD